MDLQTVQNLMDLTEGPAFVLENDRLILSNPQAEALGLRVGSTANGLPEELSLPVPGEQTQLRHVAFVGKEWVLRTLALEPWTLCLLQPEAPLIPPANDNTLLHTAGSIRQAVHELTTALDELTDNDGQDPAASHSVSLALRSIYRLRRTAGELEMFVRLRSGSYRLTPELCDLGNKTEELCGELAELLRAAGIELQWELPKSPLRVCLDWQLLSALLRELITNAALQSADRRVSLLLQRNGDDKVCFLVKNRFKEAIPERLFHRHAAENSELKQGLGIGLSLVSAGAACHGGSLLLSSEESGVMTAMLRAALCDPPPAGTYRSQVQLPGDPDLNLIALSPVLPPEAYRPDDLL